MVKILTSRLILILTLFASTNAVSGQEQVEKDSDRTPFKLTVTNDVGIGRLLSELFVINGEGFLSRPLLAKLDTSSIYGDKEYYLLAIPFNVPAVKNRLFVKYRFVRMSGKLSLNNNGKLEVLSIYPVNELLNASLENTKEQEAKFKPEWNGFAAGEFRALNKDVTKYEYSLPTVVGTLSSFTHNRHSTLSWTYYPAKRQPIVLGNKVGYGVISVERDAISKNTCLEFDATLRYELNLTVPPFAGKRRSKWKLPLSDALTLNEFLRVRIPDMKDEKLKELLTLAFKKSTPKASFRLTKHYGTTYVNDTSNGKLYKVSDSELISLKPNESEKDIAQRRFLQKRSSRDNSYRLQIGHNGKSVVCILNSKISKESNGSNVPNELPRADKNNDNTNKEILLLDSDGFVVKSVVVKHHANRTNASHSSFVFEVFKGSTSCTDRELEQISDWCFAGEYIDSEL